MIAVDTNLLLYARLAGNPFHQAAREFLEGHDGNPDFVIAELVLVEFYLALRNPAIIDSPLKASEAVEQCNVFRRHPTWQLVENADVMHSVWREAARPGFARRRIVDVRLAKTLIAHGVKEFATANVDDFQSLGFQRVWNPVAEA